MVARFSTIQLAVGVIVWFAACAAPPKQAEVPDVENDTGVDMATPESAEGSQSTDTSSEQADMQAKCCTECNAAADKDRSGASRDTIPCADFELSPWCREHFLAHPVMASKCQ